MWGLGCMLVSEPFKRVSVYFIVTIDNRAKEISKDIYLNATERLNVDTLKNL